MIFHSILSYQLPIPSCHHYQAFFNQSLLLLLFTGNVPRGVFVNKVHGKPENCGAKSCECMISVHREARYWSRSAQ